MGLPGKSLRHALLHLVYLDPPHTQTTAREGDALAACANGRTRGVEIGVHEGANTVRLAEALAPGGLLYAIDPFFPGRLGVAWGEMIARTEARRRRVRAKVRFVRALSWEACDVIPGSFDFMFIDGDHSIDGIARDWRDWSGRIEPGGIIALHDTRIPEHDPSIAELGSYRYYESHIRHDPRFELVEQVDSLSILRRRPGARGAGDAPPSSRPDGAG